MPKGKTSRENTWQCIEYYQKRFPELTYEEQVKILNDKLEKSRNSRPTSLQYWINKYPDKSINECERLFEQYQKEHNYQHIEYWVKKYPNKSLKDCEVMMNDYIQSAIKRRPDNTGINNPSHKSKTSERQRRERSVMCIEYWEKKYPNLSHEEHIRLLEDKKKEVTSKSRNAPQPTQIRYWVSMGHTEDEARKKISERQRTFTLEKCIRKYGEEEGRRVFEERQIKWQKSFKRTLSNNGDGRSPQSLFAKELIGEICLALNIDIPKKEKYITDPDTQRHYAIDFTFGRKMIEFNGDYWHCNPSQYSADYFNKSKQMFASEIWEYDKRKAECICKNSYELLTIWESEYIKDFDATLKKCLIFLND